MTEESSTVIPTGVYEKRPLFLSILLVLSMAGAAMGILLALTNIIGGHSLIQALQWPMIDTILREDAAGNVFYVCLKIILYAGSLLGVVYMWRLKKTGFYIYLCAQILMLILPFFFLGNLGSAYLLMGLLVNIIFTLFFLILYMIYLKKFS